MHPWSDCPAVFSAAGGCRTQSACCALLRCAAAAAAAVAVAAAAVALRCCWLAVHCCACAGLQLAVRSQVSACPSSPTATSVSILSQWALLPHHTQLVLLSPSTQPPVLRSPDCIQLPPIAPAAPPQPPPSGCATNARRMIAVAGVSAAITWQDLTGRVTNNGRAHISMSTADLYLLVACGLRHECTRDACRGRCLSCNHMARLDGACDGQWQGTHLMPTAVGRR